MTRVTVLAGGVGGASGSGGGALSGASGTWDGTIGQGGGGGSGGYNSSNGGSGAVSSSDTLTASIGEASVSVSYTNTERYQTSLVVHSGAINQATTGEWTEYYGLQDVVRTIAKPGSGGGAKSFLVSGNPQAYGSKVPEANPSGLVVVRLSYSLT